MSTGTITQIFGQVVDVEFPQSGMPLIYNALTVDKGTGGEHSSVILEVMQHMGGNTARAIVLGPPEGLSRGLPVVDTGKPISVPVGKACLGRLMDYAGRPIDYKGAISSETMLPIHRDPPGFLDQDTRSRVFETGIKVIDLLAPF